MSEPRKWLRNEYVRSLIVLVLILICIGAFWFGLRAFLATDYPLLAVASGSMEDTLYRGDLIVVQGGLNVNDIVAEYEVGDIVVFRSPWQQDELIVHRAVDNGSDVDGPYLNTKGDANMRVDSWKVYDNHLVGKVVGKIPYLGHVPLFVHTTTGLIIIAALVVVLLVVEFAEPLTGRKEPEKLEEARKPDDDDQPPSMQ